MISIERKPLRADALKEFTDNESMVSREFPYKTSTIDFLGVKHAFSTLNVGTNVAKLDDVIKQSNIVFLEEAPLAAGFYDREKIESLLKGLRDANIIKSNITLSQLQWSFQSADSIEFYREVERMAYLNGKVIARSDPIELIYADYFIMRALGSEDLVLSKDLSVVAGALIAYLLSDALFFGYTNKSKEPNTKNVQSNKNMSRRKFLKLAGATVFTSIFTPVFLSKLSDMLEEESNTIMNRTNNQLGLLKVGFLDYRDVHIAEGIDFLTRKYSQGSQEARNLGIMNTESTTRIGVVYGMYHLDPVEHYLTHPIEREARVAFYEQFFGKKHETPLRLYKPIGAGRTGDWEEVATHSL